MIVRHVLFAAAFATLTACAPSADYVSLCDGLSAEGEQLSCLTDASELARRDIDRRERETVRQVRDADLERDVRERAADARSEVDRIDHATGERVRDAADHRRADSLRDGLRDLEREVEDLERDLERMRDGDEVRDDDQRDDDTRIDDARDDGSDDSDRARD